MKVLILVLGLALAGMVAWTWRLSEKATLQQSEALRQIHATKDSLTHVRDSLKQEVSKYRKDSIASAARILNARRGTDSSLVLVQSLETALAGLIPDSLLRTFTRGITNIGVRVTEERLYSDNALAIEHAARATALSLATVEESRIGAVEAELVIVTKKPNKFLRALRVTTRVALIGAGAAGGAVLADAAGAAVGAIVGAVIPIK